MFVVFLMKQIFNISQCFNDVENIDLDVHKAISDRGNQQSEQSTLLLFAIRGGILVLSCQGFLSCQILTKYRNVYYRQRTISTKSCFFFLQICNTKVIVENQVV